MKNQTKVLLRFVFGAKQSEILSNLKCINYKVISFDIFDTLVVRDVESPERIFDFVQELAINCGIQCNHFKGDRIEAEHLARKLCVGCEVTYQDIYKQYQNITGMCTNDICKLMRMEIEEEQRHCHANAKIQKVFRFLLNEKQRIVITSDMYLPEEIIQGILEKCGYKEYEKIYLSSSYGVTKASGKLFEFLKEDYDNLPGEIIHIGDNIKSDFYRAKQAGLKAILIGREKNVHFYKKSVMRMWKEKCFYAFLNNYDLSSSDLGKIEKDRSVFARAVGHEILGPILWGYIQWLQKQLEADGIEKIFFLSREGDLLQKAYQIIFPDNKEVQKYLYVSRQALQVPMLLECHNYYEMIQVMKPMMHLHTLDNIGKECAFGDCYWEECRKLKLDIQSSVFDIPSEKQELYYGLVYQLGNKHFCEQKELIRIYLEQEGFKGKVAIADIGWQGTMQKALSVYCGIEEIIGYYIGVRNVYVEEYYEGLIRKGYLFEPGEYEDWNLKMRFTTEIMETLFLNSDGSVTGYCRKGNKVEPCLSKNEHKDDINMFIKEIQTAALQFIKDWKESPLSNCELAKETIMKGYEYFAVRPTLKTVNYFKDFNFFDGGMKKILLNRSLFYYICHPKKLLIDMNGSACKIFTLKGLFKMPFPYYHLLKFFLYGLKIKSPYAKNMER